MNPPVVLADPGGRALISQDVSPDDEDRQDRRLFDAVLADW